MNDTGDRTAEIEGWSRDRCLEAWERAVGRLPASRLSARFLRRALIFERQCKEYGGHSASVRRVLKAGAGGGSSRKAGPASTLPQGTQLVREWNGRIYRVNVTADGFEMDGGSFSSLSAVARQITGAQWSGPRFFGLKDTGS